jgi:hypothetical protein
MFELTLEPEVEIIDLITLISVVCISISFVYTRTKDRWFRSKKYEDEIRTAVNRKAVEAILELARFQAPRILTPEQMERAVEKLRQFRGTQYDVAIESDDPELATFLVFIDVTLERAGWVALSWAAPVRVVHRFRGPVAAIGFPLSNVTVGMHPEQAPALRLAAQCIAEELTAAGISAIAAPMAIGPLSSTNTTAIHLLVGRRL